ncbi:MAG: hypothetical protein ACR2G4_00510 [Pyrinomonadaceae bacterium]
MASLSIPKQIASGLTSIATLPEEPFQELLSALDGIPLKIKQHGVFDDSSLSLKTIPPDELKEIKEALFPLIAGQSTSTTPVSDYVDSIADSLKESDEEDVGWAHSNETLNRFKERLTRLFSVESLRLIGKARNVLFRHAQTFSSARIVSDIRPVFKEEAEEPPVAAVIVHMLNIVYHSSGERKEFVVALDTTDIHLMMDSLKRAEKKTKSLESTIASTNMTYIEVV